MAKKAIEEIKIPKKEKTNKAEKSFDMEKAITNILVSLEGIEKRLGKLEKKLSTVADDTVDVFNMVQEISEGLDLDTDDDEEDDDDDE